MPSLLLSAVGFLSVLTLPGTAAPAGVNKITGDLPYKFTLAALNLTLPNANATGAPLVLSSDGAIDGAEFSITSVRTLFRSYGCFR